MRKLVLALVALIGTIGGLHAQADEVIPAQSAHVGLKVGQCVETSVRELVTVDDGMLTTRAVALTNGVWLFEIDQTPILDAVKAKDPAIICLRSIPRGCPKGDLRGMVYKFYDLRSDGHGYFPDAIHYCGGA